MVGIKPPTIESDSGLGRTRLSKAIIEYIDLREITQIKTRGVIAGRGKIESTVTVKIAESNVCDGYGGSSLFPVGTGGGLTGGG